MIQSEKREKQSRECSGTRETSYICSRVIVSKSQVSNFSFDPNLSKLYHLIASMLSETNGLDLRKTLSLLFIFLPLLSWAGSRLRELDLIGFLFILKKPRNKNLLLTALISNSESTMPLQLFSSPLSIPLPPSLHTRPVKTYPLRLLRRVSTRLGCSSQPDPSLHSSDPLELLEKPNPMPSPQAETKLETQQPKPDLTPFLNLFSNGLSNEETPYNEKASEEESENEETNLAGLCYDPKAGEFAMGVVVSGDENKIEVDIGSDKPGIMLKKDIMPFFDEDLEFLASDLAEDGFKGYVGKMGIVRDEVEMGGGAGKSVVEIGTVVYTEVLGRTLSGRPLLSSRSLFRRLAWHRVRQVLSPSLSISPDLYRFCTARLF